MPCTWISLRYPENVIGLHLNYISGSYKPNLKDGEQLTEEVIAYQKFAMEWLQKKVPIPIFKVQNR